MSENNLFSLRKELEQNEMRLEDLIHDLRNLDRLITIDTSVLTCGDQLWFVWQDFAQAATGPIAGISVLFAGFLGTFQFP